MVKSGVQRVVYLKDFEGCKGDKNCVMLTSKRKEVLGRMEARVKPLMKAFRGMQVVSVDTDFYSVKIDAEFAKQKPADNDDEQYGEAICLSKSTNDAAFEEFSDPKAFKIK